MINKIFENLDAWRWLPSYQLERRADVFFSLYLKEILEAHVLPEVTLHPIIIPEFPLHIKFVEEKRADNRNHSFKIDYVAFSADMQRAFLVELKTDEGSKRYVQDKYLLYAKNAKMREIVESIPELFHASGPKKRKYAHLLALMQSAGLFEQSEESVVDFLQEVGNGLRTSWRGITDRVKNLEVSEKCTSMSKEIIYIKPDKAPLSTDASVISFSQIVEKVLSNKSDPFSVRFAQSLAAWENGLV